MTWYRWLGINAALFLGMCIIVSYAVYLVSLAPGGQHDPLDVALAPLAYALFTGPLWAVGFALYLAAVAMTPGSGAAATGASQPSCSARLWALWSC